jgi:GWxTD domain-containing protein
MVARNSGIHRLVFGLIAQGDTLEADKYLVVGRALEVDPDLTAGMPEGISEVPFPDQFALVLTATELSIYENLDDQARAGFYTAYWQGSPDLREGFEQRCEEAERYSSPYKEGWRTDRGRAYIIYGPPDDIEAVLFQGEQVPYEIWFYYGRGNERFVFADRSGTGDYEQVFSTIEGEVSYTNWEDMITPISGGGGG